MAGILPELKEISPPLKCCKECAFRTGVLSLTAMELYFGIKDVVFGVVDRTPMQ